jgi:tuftelin-interacting protein 11
MARRKANKGYLSDGDSSGDSSEGGDEGWDGDGDARAERDLFSDPYGNKKRKRGGKEDELYGVFAEDDEDEGFSGARNKGKGKETRTDWTK